MRESIEKKVNESLKRQRRKAFYAAAFLLLAVVISVGVFYLVRSPAEAEEYPECHLAHDDTCGYQYEIVPEYCTHVHTLECGEPGTDASPCQHDCAVNPDCYPAGKCVHNHDENCGYDSETEEGCTHICEGDCLTPICSHAEHDEFCGYAEAAAGYLSCEHVHDETCGAVVVTNQCEHTCEICQLITNEPPTEPGNNIDYAIRAIVDALRSSYNSGEIMQFGLISDRSDPNDTSPRATISIPIPEGVEVLGLNPSTSDEFLAADGWYQIAIAASSPDQQNKYMYYNKNYGGLANGAIVYTLDLGETLGSALIELRCPNGTTDNGKVIELIPRLETEGIEGKAVIEGDYTTITASFGWNDVLKVCDRTTINNYATPSYNPVYTITANKASTTNYGLMYTGEYTITDILSLNGYYIDTSAGLTFMSTTSSTTTATTVKYYTTADSTSTRMNIFNLTNLPVGTVVNIEPIYDNEYPNRVSSFKITYTISNTNIDGSGNYTADIEDLMFKLTLNTSSMLSASATYKDLTIDETYTNTYGKPLHNINNEVNFEARTIFYNDHVGEPDEELHRVSSQDDISLGTTASYSGSIEKGAYLDPTNLSNAGAKNAAEVGSTVSEVRKGDTVYFRLRFRNLGQFLNEVTISDVLPIKNGTSDSAVLLFDTNSFEYVGSYYYNAGDMTEVTPGNLDGVNFDYIILERNSYPIDNGTSGLGASYVNREAIAFHKTFQNVPKGAEIVIIYKINVLDTINIGASATVSISNYTYALREMDDNYSYEYENFLGSAVHSIKIITDKNLLTLTKTIIDETGEHMSTDPSGNATYYFNVGDDVLYQVELKNISESPISINRLVETWPYSGVRLTSITGIPAGCTLDVQTSKAYDAPVLASVNSNGEEINIDALLSTNNITQSNARYFIVKNLVVDGGETITLTFRGKVTANSANGYTNTVEGEIGDGTLKSSIVLNTILAAITTDKKAYRAVGTESVIDWSSQAEDYLNYKNGDVVRYELTVWNNSLTNTPFNKIIFNDWFDTDIFKWTTPEDNDLAVGQYGGVTGTVILEYQDGTCLPLTAYTAEGELTGNSYKVYTDHITVNVALPEGKYLQPGGEEEIKVHIFFNINERVVANYIAADHSYGMSNSVNATTTINSKPISSDMWISHRIEIEDHNLAAEVTKTAYAVIRGLRQAGADWEYDSIQFATDGEPLYAMKGDFLVYNIELDNVSPLNETEKIQITGIWDNVPANTSFIAFSSPSIIQASTGVSGFAGSGLLTTGSNYGYVDAYDKNSGGVLDSIWNFATGAASSFGGGIAYMGIADNDQSGDLWDGTLPTNWRLVYSVIVEVTENADNYLNEGGYVIENQASTKSKSVPYAEGYKLVTDTAIINGPIFDAGITKTAMNFSADGVSWQPITGSATIPQHQIEWKIVIENGTLSTGAYLTYTLEDTLPKEFDYISGSTKINGVQFEDPATRMMIDGRTVLTWEIDEPLSPGEQVTITIQTKWKNNLIQVYGLYSNEAAVTLPDEYRLRTVLHGEHQNGSQTIRDTAQINMMGIYGTESYKTIENITPTSPYYGEYGEGINESPVINAVVGDTIRYTLNVENQTSLSNGKMQSNVFIDILPNIGDYGVVNRSAQRRSEFNVKFAEDPAVSIVINKQGGGTVSLNPGEYSILYGNINENDSILEADWSGLNPSGGNVLWSTSSANCNAIRIALDDSVEIFSGDEVSIAFNAVVVGISASTTVPNNDDIAWNSFGYTYKISDIKLYAEPIKVGVKIPILSIEVDKTVVNKKGVEVSLDDAEFEFTVYRSLTSNGDWEIAKYVQYYDGTLVYNLGENGTFRLKHLEGVTIYAPAGYYYKIVETDDPDDLYTLANINGDRDAEFYVTTSTAVGDNLSASFVNEREDVDWTITLNKKAFNGDIMQGVTFSLEVLQDDGETWLTVEGYESVATDANGKIVFTDLPTGTYRISELEVGEPYQPVEPIIITLPFDAANAGEPPYGVTFEEGEDDGDVTVDVVNYLKYRLPETGGGGLLKLMIFGSALLAAAGAPFVIKKKRGGREHS